MTEEARHVYLFVGLGGIEKYCPLYDSIRSIPSSNPYNVGCGRGKRVDIREKRLVFKCDKVRTEAEEKCLRSHDLLRGGPGRFFFINDRIMNCLSHIVDKDIQVLPSEIYTRNGLVSGYHLINVMNTVYGIDKERSGYCEITGLLEKLVPKNEDFMEGHEVACEAEAATHIYIVPTLRENLLKSKNGELKGLSLWTTKEYWEALYNSGHKATGIY